MAEPLLLIHDAQDLAPPADGYGGERSPPGPDGRWLLFRRPRAIRVARQLAEIGPLLESVQQEVDQGAWAAGFLAYEAGPAFDPALAAHPLPGPLPLAWWGLFDPPQILPGGDLPPRGVVPVPTAEPSRPALDWRPALDHRTFRQRIETIHQHIARGETYQVNFTFPLETPFSGHPYPLFEQWLKSQRGARYAAYLDLGSEAGDLVICSLSPELFVAGRGEKLLVRPMKGTAPRGRFPREDALFVRRLRESPKEQAENVMIVDMLRNDLGRLARPGSVRVEALYTVETYPTVHQLTSTVRAESTASFAQLMTALFPCASITGAPKVATSRLIHRLEAGPRGIYTGSLGFLSPEGLQLSVAIRTAVIDRAAGRATYGVGSGVVWDSRAEAEYAECRAKARVLAEPTADFGLFETFLWRPYGGYLLLRHHLERLAASARHFGFRHDPDEVAGVLERAVAGSDERSRVRLELRREGSLKVDAKPWPRTGRRPWRLALDDRPVDSRDPLLFHKTTLRRRYDDALERARARLGEVDEVVLWNEKGELTEGCRTNLVLDLGGRRLTPRLEAGLLPGTYRAALLARGRLAEERLVLDDLVKSRQILLINALRGWIRGHLDPGETKLGRTPRPDGTTSTQSSIQSVG